MTSRLPFAAPIVIVLAFLPWALSVASGEVGSSFLTQPADASRETAAPTASHVRIVIVLAFSACGDSGDADECAASCTATVRFQGDIGIPADIGAFTLSMCGGVDCVEMDIDVPDTEVEQSTGEDPSLAVVVTKTNQDHHEDYQGIFAIDATWSSASLRLSEGDLVGFSTTRPDGGNIASTLHTLDVDEVAGTCGCPLIELDI